MALAFTLSKTKYVLLRKVGKVVEVVSAVVAVRVFRTEVCHLGPEEQEDLLKPDQPSSCRKWDDGQT